MSVVVAPDVCAHARRLREAFGPAGPAGEAPLDARYEVYLRSVGPSGALVDAAPASAAPYAAAVARLGTAYQRNVLHAVLRGTAARRRVLKCGIDGALSLFHAVTVPIDRLPRLADGFGVTGAAARRVRDALMGTGLPVCGWAVEVPGRPDRWARLRCYAMLPTGTGPDRLLTLATGLGMTEATRRSIAWHWDRLAGADDVVVNLDLVIGGSVKAEFASPSVAVLHDLSAPRAWVADVDRLAARLGAAELDQLGVRWSANSRADLCAYLAVEGRPA